MQNKIYLRTFNMENLFGAEKRLKIGNKEKNTGIVKCWQFVVQFRIKNFISSLSFFHHFSASSDLFINRLLIMC